MTNRDKSEKATEPTKKQRDLLDSSHSLSWDSSLSTLKIVLLVKQIKILCWIHLSIQITQIFEMMQKPRKGYWEGRMPLWGVWFSHRRIWNPSMLPCTQCPFSSMLFSSRGETCLVHICGDTLWTLLVLVLVPDVLHTREKFPPRERDSCATYHMPHATTCTTGNMQSKVLWP